MAHLMGWSDDAADREGRPEAVVLLYCRAGKKLPYVFCGRLGDIEEVRGDWAVRHRLLNVKGASTMDQDSSAEPVVDVSASVVLEWRLLDFLDLQRTSQHFRDLVEFHDVSI